MDQKDVKACTHQISCKAKIHKGTTDERELSFLFEINVETDELVKITIVKETWNDVIYPARYSNFSDQNVDSLLITTYLRCYQFCDFPDIVKKTFENISVPSILYFYKEKGFIAKTLKDIADNVPVKDFPKGSHLEYLWSENMMQLFPYDYDTIPKGTFALDDMRHDGSMKKKGPAKCCGLCGKNLAYGRCGNFCSIQCHKLMDSGMYYIHCRNCGVALQKTDMCYECVSCSANAGKTFAYKRPSWKVHVPYVPTEWDKMQDRWAD